MKRRKADRLLSQMEYRGFCEEKIESSTKTWMYQKWYSETDEWKSWLWQHNHGIILNGNKYFSQISLLEYFHLNLLIFVVNSTMVQWNSIWINLLIFGSQFISSLRDCKGHMPWTLLLQWHKPSCFQILEVGESGGRSLSRSIN